MMKVNKFIMILVTNAVNITLPNSTITLLSIKVVMMSLSFLLYLYKFEQPNIPL